MEAVGICGNILLLVFDGTNKRCRLYNLDEEYLCPELNFDSTLKLYNWKPLTSKDDKLKEFARKIEIS